MTNTEACVCGNKPTIKSGQGYGRYWFVCEACDIESVREATEDEAAIAWNILIEEWKKRQNTELTG